MEMGPKLVQCKRFWGHDGFRTKVDLFGHWGWSEVPWQFVINIGSPVAEKYILAFSVPREAFRIGKDVGGIKKVLKFEMGNETSQVILKAWPCSPYRERMASTNSFFRREKPPLPHIRGTLPQKLSCRGRQQDD